MKPFLAGDWWRSHKAKLFRGLVLLLLWLALLDFPRDVAGEELDFSWMQCLGHFLKNRAQCGVEYVWTYGPLGYFTQAVYDADLFWWKYVWELSVKFAFVWILLRWASLLGGGWVRVLFVGLTLVFLAGSVDALYLVAIVLMGLLAVRDAGCRTAGRLFAGTMLLAVLSLTKGTFLLVGAAVWIVGVLAPELGRRRRIALAIGFPLTAVLLWLLLGQKVGSMASFLTGSLEIARGYSEGMAAEGAPRAIYLGLAGVTLFLALLAAYPWSVLRRRGNLLGVALLSASLFLAWKHGFTRQASHTPHFFNYLLFVPFAVEGLLGGATTRTALRAGLTTALVVLAVLGGESLPQPDAWLNRLRQNGAIVLAPIQLKHALDKWHAERADEWALPAIQQQVGREPTDQISVAQGIVLLNQLNYRPRPVFQSYSAYTPELLARNADFYRSERAPAFVLWKLDPLDGHVPAMEDGPTLLEVFRAYRPVLREKGFLLLKRLADSDRANGTERPVLLRRDLAFEEEVPVEDLGTTAKILAVRIEDSAWGRLRKAVFRPPPLFLNLHATDGKTYAYRLIPGMATAGFLLDPLVRGDEDIVDLYAGRPLPRVRSFSLHADPEARKCWQRVSVVVWGEEKLIGTVTPRIQHPPDSQ